MSLRVALRARVGRLALDVELSCGPSPVALIGPNGSGKTTLLRLIAGAEYPVAGRIELFDQTLFDSECGLSVPTERRGVGYLPQGHGLFPHLSVLDNVAFGLSMAPGRPSLRARRGAALALLSELDASHLAERWPVELSGGEQQRVALARALLVDPQLLLMDEPLSALDAAVRRQLRGFLADRLKQRAQPALVVTHDARDVRALGASVCVMIDGRIVQRGSADELQRAPATDFVAEFFGGGEPLA